MRKTYEVSSAVLMTSDELMFGAITLQESSRHCYAEARSAFERGMNDYAAAWQQVAAQQYRGGFECLANLLC